MPRSASALRKTGRIRVGLLGDGSIALSAHLAALNQLPEYELIAASSQIRMEAGCGVHPELRCSALSATGLLRHPDIDLVAIAGASIRAQSWIIDAATAGKDIFCEWPIAPDPQIATELAAFAKSSGVDHFIGLHPRISRSNLYIADLVAQGYVGQIRSIRLFAGLPKFPDPVPQGHFDSHKEPLVVTTLRLLDGLLPLIGRPQSLYCLTSSSSTSVEDQRALQRSDQLYLLGSAKHGAIFSVHVDQLLGPPKIQIDLAGDRGKLKSISPSHEDSGDLQLEAARDADLPMQQLSVPRIYNWSSSAHLPSTKSALVDLYAAFVRDLHEATTMVATLDDGARLHHLLQSILDSSNAGRTIDLR